MSITLDMLRHEHKTMAKLLDVLDTQIALFEQAQRPDYQLLSEIIDYFRSFPDLYHHPKEDLILEHLAKRDPAAAARVGNLERDHAQCSLYLDAFARCVVKVLLEAEVPRDTFVKVARAFLDNERRHIKAEEEVFFPAADAKLTADDWREIDNRVAKFKDPLLDREVPIRYASIHGCIS